jgi:hypothetical protein
MIAAATHKRKSEIEQWLARSFPIPGVPASVRAVPALEPAHDPQLAPGQVDDREQVGSPSAVVGPNQDQLAPGQVDDTRAEDGCHERFLVQVTIAKSTQQKLAYAQEAERRARDRTQDIVAGLRSLGCRMNEARHAAEFSSTLDRADLEEQMRAALTFVGRRPAHTGTPCERSSRHANTALPL